MVWSPSGPKLEVTGDRNGQAVETGVVCHNILGDRALLISVIVY